MDARIVFRHEPFDEPIIIGPGRMSRVESLMSMIPYTTSIVHPEAYAALCVRTRLASDLDVISVHTTRTSSPLVGQVADSVRLE